MPSTSAAGVGDARGLALRGGIVVEVDVAEVQQAGEDLEQGALLLRAVLRDALQDGRVEVGELRLVVDLFHLHAAGLAWILAVASCRATMHAPGSACSRRVRRRRWFGREVEGREMDRPGSFH
jgi:hypothetical protein